MATNEHIEKVIDRAIYFAKDSHHEYVTIEHILWSLLHEKEVVDLLLAVGAQPSKIKNECISFLGNPELELPAHLAGKQAPKRTAALDRVFQRALTVLVFSGQSELTPDGILVSILSEEESPAAYFLNKNGAVRDNIVERLREVADDSRAEAEKPHLD